MTSGGVRETIIWVLLGRRAGDNAQALAVAEAVGGRAVLRQLDYNPLHAAPNLLLGASLSSLRPAARGDIHPPWPDLVIGVGRRSVPVARWIRAQSEGRAKLVHIGRPRAPLDWFDLVLTTPQYYLPQQANVLQLLLPPIAPPAIASSDLARWRETFATLPRPWIGVLAGGGRAPYRFDAPAALALAREADAAAARLGGGLLVSTSPRTGEAQGRALADAISSPAHVDLWQPGAKGAHQAILALADRFIVTCESVSMLAEACRTGRPVAIHELPRLRVYPAWSGGHGLGRLLARAGLVSPPRDPAAVVRLLLEGGHASLLGAPEPARFTPAPDERPRIVAAIRALLEA